jgi:hypothetical protein
VACIVDDMGGRGGAGTASAELVTMVFQSMDWWRCVASNRLSPSQGSIRHPLATVPPLATVGPGIDPRLMGTIYGWLAVNEFP